MLLEKEEDNCGGGGSFLSLDLDSAIAFFLRSSKHEWWDDVEHSREATAATTTCAAYGKIFYDSSATDIS